MNTRAMQWGLIAMTAAIAASIITAGILWDASIKPKPQLPKYGQRASYAIEGMNRLVNASGRVNLRTNPKYVIHMVNADARRFSQRLRQTAPRLGWHATTGPGLWDLALTVPEKDIGEIEQMTIAPQTWLLEAMARPRLASVDDGPLINVLVEVDGHHGRSLWPMALLGIGITAAVAAAFSSIIVAVAEPCREERAA